MPSQPEIQFTALTDWMAETGTTFRGLSDISGVDKMTLNRLAKGTIKQFNPDLIARVSKATKKKVGEPQFVAFFGEMSRKRRAA